MPRRTQLRADGFLGMGTGRRAKSEPRPRTRDLDGPARSPGISPQLPLQPGSRPPLPIATGPPVCSRLSPRAGVRRRGQDHTDVPKPHMTNILLHEESRLLTAGPQGDRAEAPSERRPPRADRVPAPGTATPPLPRQAFVSGFASSGKSTRRWPHGQPDYPDTSATQVRSRRPGCCGRTQAATPGGSSVSSLFPWPALGPPFAIWGPPERTPCGAAVGSETGSI